MRRIVLKLRIQLYVVQPLLFHSSTISSIHFMRKYILRVNIYTNMAIEIVEVIKQKKNGHNAILFLAILRD